VIAGGSLAQDQKKSEDAMKVTLIALIGLISMTSSSFAWGPRSGAITVRPVIPRTVIVRPFFPRFVGGGAFVRVPFGFFPNRTVIPSRFVLTPGWYGSYYSAPNYYYRPYAYAPPYPNNNYPSYGYAPVVPNPDTYDRGYSEGYARGYEEAQKEISRLLDLEKNPSDEHEKSGDEESE
jgi:hypothetical protein